MAYLRKRDFFTEIKEGDLDELLEEITAFTSYTPNKIFDETNLKIEEKVKTMIRQRYDVDKIFKDVIPFVLADTYQIDDLVQYSETAYDATLTYALNDRVSFSQTQTEGNQQVLTDDIFKNTTAVTSAEAFDSTKWLKTTENKSLYFCQIPSTNNNPDTGFAYTTNNFTGSHDLIEGWDLTNSLFLTRDNQQVRMYYSSADRSNDENSVGIVKFDPPANEFPDNRPIDRGTDEENRLEGTLSFIGFLPDETDWSVVPSNFFIKGDNRNRDIKGIMVDLAIANLHNLTPKRNVPEQRLEAKDDAMAFLKQISSGEVTADLPIFFDEQRGQNLVYDSNPKKSWVY